VRNAAIVGRNTGVGSIEALAVAGADPDPTVAASARRALDARARTGAPVRTGATV
jgi:hypothetical protein